MTTSQNILLFRRYGPWAVVTGASSGIGRAIAVELAAAGLNLIVVARSAAELARLAAEVSSRHGVRVETVAADLSGSQGIEAVRAAASGQEVGLLIAAAGFGTAGSFLDANEAEECAMLDVNCRAVLALSLHFGRRFAERGRGGMVLFGSLVAFQGVPRAAHYAATKAYVQSLAEALHVELAPRGVDVLAVAPGPVRSGFEARSQMRLSMADNPEAVASATLAALGRSMGVVPGPVGKLLTYSLRTAPRALRVRIMAKIMGGMTAHLGQGNGAAKQTNRA
jgi:short-subunit dehydrogenase